jgi:hypothetical protein
MCKKHENRKYYQNNKKKHNESTKLYYETNKNELSEKSREYYQNNKAEKISHQKKYRADHKEQRNFYERERRCNDVEHKLRHNLRARLNQAIKNNSKFGSAVRDLGCSIGDLKRWLEQQFQPGMSWENYGNGRGKWNIDHIVPLFNNLSDQRLFAAVNHWFNLRPMWSEENVAKGANL